MDRKVGGPLFLDQWSCFLVSHSSLSKLLGPQSFLIQAVTVIIYTWKIWKRWRKRKLRGANYISSKPGTSGVVWNQDCNTLLRTTGGGMPFGGKIEVWGSSSSWIGIMSDFVLFNVYEACKICNETSASTWCNTRAKMDLILPEVATYIKFQFLSLFWGDYKWSIILYTIPMLLCFNMTDRVICPKYQCFWELNKSGFVPYLLGPSMRLGS